MSTLEIPLSINLLKSLLHKNPSNLEIIILPTFDDINNRNNDRYPQRSFLLINQNLAIHATDIPKLSRDFRCYYKSLRRKKDQFIENEMINMTKCLLIIFPDDERVWADRRRCIMRLCNVNDKRSEDIVNDELRFLDFLFTWHSKAPSAWMYRKWICRRIVSHYATNNREYHKWHQQELRSITKVTNQFPKNYYGWTHRLFIMLTLYEQQTIDSVISYMDKIQIFQKEIEFVVDWLQRYYVGDHSAVHYVSEMLSRWCKLYQQNRYYHATIECKWDSTDNSNGQRDYKQTILRILQNLVHHSQKITQNHNFKDNETIWIWKRVCILIYLNALAHEIVKEFQEEGNNSHKPIIGEIKDVRFRIVLESLIQSEIVETWNDITPYLDSSNKCTKHTETIFLCSGFEVVQRKEEYSTSKEMIRTSLKIPKPCPPWILHSLAFLIWTLEKFWSRPCSCMSIKKEINTICISYLYQILDENYIEKICFIELNALRVLQKALVLPYLHWNYMNHKRIQPERK